MTEEHKPEHHAKKIDVLGYFKKWRKIDWLALVVVIAFVVLISIPAYLPKNGCEVARPNYKCESAKNVINENCNLWAQSSCGTSSSTEEVEWYIGDLCVIHNRYNSDKLDCSNLKLACNQATGTSTCPVG